MTSGLYQSPLRAHMAIFNPPTSCLNTFSSLISLFYLLLYSHLASSLPSNAPGDVSLSLPAQSSHATSLGAPIPNCASLPKWAEWFHESQKFNPGDCDQAINLFYNDYVKDHGGTRYEYLVSGVAPVHGIPTQRVPLKLAVGKCSSNTLPWQVSAAMVLTR